MKSIYLVAYYFQRPKHNKVKTNRSGWMSDNNNVSWDEQVTVCKNLKNRDYTIAKIILDLGNKKVVKDGWDTKRSFDELFVYFNQEYKQYTHDIMAQIDPAYLEYLFPTDKKILDTSSSISST